MAIIFDSTSSSSNSPPNLSYTHVLNYGVGNDRLVVTVICPRGTTNTVTGCTYNGVAMTRGPETYVDQFGYRVRATLFYILDSSLPADEGTYTVAFTVGGTVWDWTSGTSSVINAVQGAPEQTATDTQLTGSTMSTTIASVSDGAMVFDGLCVDLTGGSGTVSSGQTERWDVSRSGDTGMGSTHLKSGAGSRAMGWTFNTTGSGCAHVVASWAAVSGGGGGAPLVVDTPTAGHANSNSVTVSYTFSANTNKKLIVFAGGECSSTGQTVTGVTYNGVALTQVDQRATSPSNNVVSAWYLDNASFPGTPGAYNVVASYSATFNECIVHIVGLSDAAQGAPSVTNWSTINSSTTISTSITTVLDNSLILGSADSSANVTATPTSGQTELLETALVATLAQVTGSEEIATASAQSMDWTWSSSSPRAVQIVLAIAPSSAAESVVNAAWFGCDF